MKSKFESENDEIQAHLSTRLMSFAGRLNRDGVLPEAEIAITFAMTGAEIAARHGGGVAAAEWLRDLADTIERADRFLLGRLQ